MSRILLRTTVLIIFLCSVLYLLSYDSAFISQDSKSGLRAYLYSNPLFGDRIEIKDSNGRTIKKVNLSQKLNHELYIDWEVPSLRIRFDREVHLKPDIDHEN